MTIVGGAADDSVESGKPSALCDAAVAKMSQVSAKPTAEAAVLPVPPAMTRNLSFSKCFAVLLGREWTIRSRSIMLTKAVAARTVTLNPILTLTHSSTFTYTSTLRSYTFSRVPQVIVSLLMLSLYWQVEKCAQRDQA